MLIDIILYLVGSFVALIQGALGLISITIPDQFINSIYFFTAKLSYLEGFLNIPDILSATGWFLTFTTYWYSVKVILWVFGLVPWFGKSVSPKV